MSLAVSLLIYAGLIVLLIFFSLVVVFNFVRYRFEGDKTLLFIGLFYVAFVVTIISTMLLTRTPGAVPTDSPIPLFF